MAPDLKRMKPTKVILIRNQVSKMMKHLQMQISDFSGESTIVTKRMQTLTREIIMMMMMTMTIVMVILMAMMMMIIMTLLVVLLRSGSSPTTN